VIFIFGMAAWMRGAHAKPAPAATVIDFNIDLRFISQSSFNAPLRV